jgi:hypothetical protein
MSDEKPPTQIVDRRSCRMVEVGEVLPKGVLRMDKTHEPADDDVPKYSERQMRAIVATAKQAINRSAGKTILGMMHGMTDIAREANDDPAKAGELIDRATAAREQALEEALAHNEALMGILCQRDQTIADLNAQLAALAVRVEAFAKHFEG